MSLKQELDGAVCDDVHRSHPRPHARGDARAPRESAEAEGVDLDTLLSQSDIVCVHTLLDLDTKALIDGPALNKMKPGSILINAARGPIVDEEALVEALLSGHLGGPLWMYMRQSRCRRTRRF